MIDSTPLARARMRAATLLALAMALLAVPLALRAQDTTHAVRIGLTYQPGTKPGVIVLPVRGAWGDSLQGLIARDLDYGDRIEVIGLPGTPANSSIQTMGPGVSYPLWKSLGAVATVQATEEAVINAMVAADTMTGINDHTVIALPHDRLREALKKYNRLAK